MNFRETLDEVIDVDAFATYWAMEVITDHWDGYANNRNNYFFYHDPTSDKLHFIPWGIDALFTGRQRSTRPKSVFACGRLAWRMYDEASTRELYLTRLRELLGSVWDESAILGEISRMQTLLQPFVDPQNTGDFANTLDGTRAFVNTRRADLLAELDAGPPVWPFPAGEESCRIVIGEISASFETTWDSLEEFGGSGTMTGTVASESVMTSTVFASAGLSEDSQGLIQLFGQLDDGRFAIVFLFVRDPTGIRPGFAAIDLVNVAAIMTFYDPATDTTSGGGLILGGNITFSSASMVTGAPIIGSMTGEILEF